MHKTLSSSYITLKFTLKYLKVATKLCKVFASNITSYLIFSLTFMPVSNWRKVKRKKLCRLIPKSFVLNLD